MTLERAKTMTSTRACESATSGHMTPSQLEARMLERPGARRLAFLVAVSSFLALLTVTLVIPGARPFGQITALTGLIGLAGVGAYELAQRWLGQSRSAERLLESGELANYGGGLAVRVVGLAVRIERLSAGSVEHRPVRPLGRACVGNPIVSNPSAPIGREAKIFTETLDRLAQGAVFEVDIGLVFAEAFLERFHQAAEVGLVQGLAVDHGGDPVVDDGASGVAPLSHAGFFAMLALGLAGLAGQELARL